MAEILFPAYREYKDSRVQVNDAMSALLVGARVAAHTLTLTAGSTATLGQLFPTVDHIDRFNMRSDVARDFLNSADHHVASVAIPYALATHEDFTMSMISMVKEEGWDLRVGNKPIRAWNMHAVLFGVFHEQEPSSWIESFHVLREMRNCITHSGGRVDQKLREALQQMSAESRQGWSSINNGTEPENMEGPTGRLDLTAEHMFTAFAVTKRLGREINKLLANHLSPQHWARIAVSDYSSTTGNNRNSSNWRRSLAGYTRMNYAGVQLKQEHLEAAARELGLWTVAKWE